MRNWTDPNVVRLWTEFDIDLDLSKAGDAEKRGRGPIRGVASTESVDADGEVVIQKGIDWSWFTNHGFFTLEHPIHAMNIIGEPLELEHTEIDGVPATLVKGELYLEDPVGLAVWKKAVAIRKSGGQRRLGMSIEGRVLERDGKTIKRSDVRSIAISPQPRNKDAWFEPLAASRLGMGVNPMGMYGMPYGQFPNVHNFPVQQKADSGMVGYPGEGVARDSGFVGGIAPLVRESLQGNADNASFGNGMDLSDVLITRVLKKYPHLTWAQGLAAVKQAKGRLRLEDKR